MDQKGATLGDARHHRLRIAARGTGFWFWAGGGENTAPEVINILTKFGFEALDYYLVRGTFLLKNSRLIDQRPANSTLPI